jgi:hypothetical protein
MNVANRNRQVVGRSFGFSAFGKAIVRISRLSQRELGICGRGSGSSHGLWVRACSRLPCTSVDITIYVFQKILSYRKRLHIKPAVLKVSD